MAERITFLNDQALYDALISPDAKAQNRGFDYLYQELYQYQELHQEYYGGFQQWVYKRNGSDKEAGDAFQSGLLNFVINLRSGKYQLQPHTKITTVVFDYCKKVYLNRINSAGYKRQGPLPDNLDDIGIKVVNAPDAPDTIVEQNETVMQVNDCLKKIGQDCDELLTDHYIEGLSLAEIAEKLKITEAAAKQRLYVCRKKLRACMILKTPKNKN